MKTCKNKKWFAIVIAVVMVAPILVIGMRDNAFGVDACATEECQEARRKANEAEAKSADSLSAAQEYELKVQEISNSIAAQQKKIETTEEKIDELKDEITKTKANLSKKQEALAEMLVNQHFESDKEPIKILASSESISDLAEKASREDTARRQIGTAAEAVRNAKQKLEDDKQQVEDLLEEQQETRKELVASRKEQQEIQKKYEADAEGFAQEAREAREKQLAEEAAYRAANPNLFNVASSGYYSASNGYEWAGLCPERNMAGQDAWGWPLCQCTSYAAWAANRYAGVIIPSTWPDNWGNASDWAANAMAQGYRVDHNPEPMSIGQSGAWVNGALEWGHVFWVEKVEGDTVYISEYNGPIQGDFYSRTITNNDGYWYIHVRG